MPDRDLHQQKRNKGTHNNTGSDKTLTMKLLSVLLLCFRLLRGCSGEVVLSEKVMKLALTSAELSSLAYEEDPPAPGNVSHFGFFDEEPDQALVAELDGYCFAAFRGTTMTWVDWSQNFELGKEEICREELLGPTTCCTTRSGFYKAYYTKYQKELEDAVRKCAKNCENPAECVVFTGHSQGGAIAAVAGLTMSDLNPYVITFGQPATIDAPCPLLSSERWFRFVNTKASDVGVAYDPVPFVPGLGAGFFGHMIILGEDPSGVAWIGLDANDVFGPLNIKGFEAHSMHALGVPHPGYWDRIHALVSNATSFPIRANGFADNSLCSEGRECMSGQCGREVTFAYSRCIGSECTVDHDCETGRCDSGACLPKLGSCMECNEDSDCAGARCVGFRCSNDNGLMDDNCKCHWDEDCQSGRCELIETGECEAQLPVGASCNEDSDCKSGYCSWRFACEAKKAVGTSCYFSSECESGSCSWFRCRAMLNTGASVEPAMMFNDASNSSESATFVDPLFTMFICGLVASGMLVNYVVPLLPSYRRYREGYSQIASATTV